MALLLDADSLSGSTGLWRLPPPLAVVEARDAQYNVLTASRDGAVP